MDGASLAELSTRAGVPRATAHRLAQALAIHRLLVRDNYGRWHLGPRLAEFANTGPDLLLAAADPALAAPCEATGQTALLFLRRRG